jgi:hypothetical protein
MMQWNPVDYGQTLMKLVNRLLNQTATLFGTQTAEILKRGYRHEECLVDFLDEPLV